MSLRNWKLAYWNKLHVNGLIPPRYTKKLYDKYEVLFWMRALLHDYPPSLVPNYLAQYILASISFCHFFPLRILDQSFPSVFYLIHSTNPFFNVPLRSYPRTYDITNTVDVNTVCLLILFFLCPGSVHTGALTYSCLTYFYLRILRFLRFHDSTTVLKMGKE